MFGFKRKRTTKALALTSGGMQKNPNNKLTKKQKQQLRTKADQIESDLNAVVYNLNTSEEIFQKLTEVEAHAPQDLQKIEFAISKEWYTACAELCYSNNWHNAASSFNEAERLEKNHGFVREHQDAAATGMVRIERQVRDDRRKLSNTSKMIKVLKNRKQVLEQKLAQLKQ